MITNSRLGKGLGASIAVDAATGVTTIVTTYFAGHVTDSLLGDYLRYVR